MSEGLCDVAFYNCILLQYQISLKLETASQENMLSVYSKTLVAAALLFLSGCTGGLAVVSL